MLIGRRIVKKRREEVIKKVNTRLAAVTVEENEEAVTVNASTATNALTSISTVSVNTRPTPNEDGNDGDKLIIDEQSEPGRKKRKSITRKKSRAIINKVSGVFKEKEIEYVPFPVKPESPKQETGPPIINRLMRNHTSYNVSEPEAATLTADLAEPLEGEAADRQAGPWAGGDHRPMLFIPRWDPLGAGGGPGGNRDSNELPPREMAGRLLEHGWNPPRMWPDNTWHHGAVPVPLVYEIGKLEIVDREFLHYSSLVESPIGPWAESAFPAAAEVMGGKVAVGKIISSSFLVSSAPNVKIVKSNSKHGFWMHRHISSMAPSALGREDLGYSIPINPLFDRKFLVLLSSDRICFLTFT